MTDQLPPPNGDKRPRINMDLVREVQNHHRQSNDQQDAQAKQGQYHYHQYNTYSTQAQPPLAEKSNTGLIAAAIIGGALFLGLIGLGLSGSDDASSIGTAKPTVGGGQVSSATDQTEQPIELGTIEAPPEEDLGPSDEQLDARFDQFQRKAIVNKFQQAGDDGMDFFYVMSNQTRQGMCGGDKMLVIGTSEGAVPFEANGTNLFILMLYDAVDATMGKMIVGRYRLNKPTLKMQGMQEGRFDDDVGTDLRPADDVGWKNLPLQLVTNDSIPNYTQFKVNGINYRLCLTEDFPKNQPYANGI